MDKGLDTLFYFHLLTFLSHKYVLKSMLVKGFCPKFVLKLNDEHNLTQYEIFFSSRFRIHGIIHGFS